jgi:hypothetical protein
MKKSLDKALINLLYRAYAAGFGAGQECEIKGLRGDYPFMRKKRKDYIDKNFIIKI